MTVERTTAYKTTSGRCFTNKAEAYHEEMVWLVQTRGTVNKRGFDPSVFDDAIAQQKGMVAALTELRGTLSPKKDSNIIEPLDLLLDAAKGWLTSAEELQDNMTSDKTGE